MMKRESKINYPFILLILVAVLYTVCLSTKILSPFWLNFIWMIFLVIYAVCLFLEWKKSHRRLDFLCFILSLIGAFLMIGYVTEVLMGVRKG